MAVKIFLNSKQRCHDQFVDSCALKPDPGNWPFSPSKTVSSDLPSLNTYLSLICHYLGPTENFLDNLEVLRVRKIPIFLCWLKNLYRSENSYFFNSKSVFFTLAWLQLPLLNNIQLSGKKQGIFIETFKFLGGETFIFSCVSLLIFMALKVTLFSLWNYFFYLLSSNF